MPGTAPDTVADLLLARAADDRVGLRCGDASWTWREVVAECAARAAWLTGRETPHVGVLLDNVPEMVFLLGGAALSGRVIVGLNTTRSADELAADAERADCGLLVAGARHADLASAVAKRTGLSVVSEVTGGGRVESVAVEPETLLMLIFTSGTSGRPRAVRVTHRKVVVPGTVLAGRLLGPDDVVYCPMPLFHSGAIMAAYAPALAAGAQLVLRDRFSASGLLPDLRRYGCTYLQYVGKALSYVLATPERDDDADNPLRVAFGNEAAPLEQKRFAERFGCRVVDGYGSTETAISFSPDPAGPPGALGRLAGGVKILDQETGEECPPARLDEHGRVVNGDAAIGELVGTAGPGLFDGYYNERADDRLRDGMFYSGDLAYRDEDGFAFFAGRDADRLRVDGENFGAAQVERVLDEYPGARQLVVYGVPDVAAGDQVMVALTGDFDPAEFQAFLAGRDDLSPKWLPRYVRLAPSLPATASNKILKRRLVRDAWHTRDPLWWRPDDAFVRMTPDDVTWLRGEFDRRGRAHIWPDRSR